MVIAFLGDSHLSNIENTPQRETLSWALEELNRIRPDACVWLGDISACGNADVASSFLKEINELPFPSAVVPGNSDLRDPATAEELQKLLLTPKTSLQVGTVSIVAMDTSRNRILPEERERLTRLQTGDSILLCSHQSAKFLDPDSQDFIRGWIRDREAKGQRVLLWANGHRHIFERGDFEGTPTLSVNALDPDKCRFSSAQICFLHFERDGQPTLETAEYSRILPHSWTEAERREFADYLGITCYNRSKVERDMPFAIQNRVKHLEWRSISEGEIALIEQWRRAGGETFSLHMSGLSFDEGVVVGFPKLRDLALDALRAGADMITVHPPMTPNGQMGMDSPSPTFHAIADAMAEAFLPVAEAGIDILVENNHTSHGTSGDPSLQPFGCTPDGVIAWRDALNERLGADCCHLRLDIGHARNNRPLCEQFPLGRWYAHIGDQVHSYHLHQTLHDKETGKMHNHHPITGWHDGLISLDGFLWGWHAGVLRHGPLILEIREGEGAPATWLRLRNLLLP